MPKKKKEKEEVEESKKIIEEKSDNKKEKNIQEKKEVKENKEKKEALIKKEDTIIDEKKMEEIGEEIRKQTTISKKRQNKISTKIFKNIVAASIIITYFIFINLGYTNLEPQTYLVDLQVFSMIAIGITILFFEQAYKKDSDELALFGIEILILSICTLMTLYIGTNYKEKYTYIINLISMLFAIYYVAKSIVIYCKMRRKALKRVSDINKIGRIK